MTQMQVLLSALLLGGIATTHGGAATGAPVTSAVPDAAPDRGAAVYGKWCSDCHSTPGGPGSMALARKYNGALPAILNQRSDLSPEYISQVVRHGVSFMPSFRKTEISDAELARLGAWLTPAAPANHRVTRHAPRAAGGE